MRLSTARAVAASAVFAFLAFLLAILGAFLVPYDPVPGASVGIAIAVVGNYALTTGGRRAVGSGVGAVVPALVWLVTTVTLAGGRPEGDLVLTGSATSLGFIVLGALAAAIGIGRRPPRAAPSDDDDQGPAPEPLPD